MPLISVPLEAINDLLAEAARIPDITRTIISVIDSVQEHKEKDKLRLAAAGILDVHDKAAALFKAAKYVQEARKCP